MWYPETVTVAPTAEPISTVDAKRHCRVDHGDDDAELDMLAASARAHVEKYTNTRLSSRTVTIRCDRFCDFGRLPIAPVSEVASIAYVDELGAPQTLSQDVYELRADGLEASIVRKYGQQWPAAQPGSRITVTALVGYAVIPPDIKHAMLLFISDSFEQRENAKAEDWTALDALLSNHRYGA